MFMYICMCMSIKSYSCASQKVVIKNALVFQAYLNLDGDLVSRQIRRADEMLMFWAGTLLGFGS